CLQLDQLVGADDLEIGAERQHLAVHLLSPHLAACDRNDAADTVTDFAGGRHVRDVRRDGEGVLGAKDRSHLLPFEQWLRHESSLVCSLPPCGGELERGYHALRYLWLPPSLTLPRTGGGKLHRAIPCAPAATARGSETRSGLRAAPDR